MRKKSETHIIRHRSSYNYTIDHFILGELVNGRNAGIGYLRREYHKRTGILLSWITAKRHIDNLLIEGKIRIQDNQGTEKRQRLIIELM